MCPLFLSWSYIIVLNDLITKNECCFFFASLMKAHYCFQNVTRNILCHKKISFSLVSFSCNVFVLNYFTRSFVFFGFWFLRHHLLAFNSILHVIIRKIQICTLIFWHKQVQMQMHKENHFMEINLKLRNAWCVN